ncbi:hypothetical protein [Dechloromonas denitrificans]|uniref:hypothetical protein n=1 Tax=Dechloromonas denitrificans TaxID=281362 RepID=UPI001CF82FFF|nr:hypothetical protein [Dechloromonas denitrificans]UCV04477.1 hypothetical protein KI611_04205 [Dechloromonas denitrificans]
MTSKDELRDLRTLGEIEAEAQFQLFHRERVQNFEAKLAEVSEKLEGRLRAAARLGYLELKLIDVDLPDLIDRAKVCCIDPVQRNSTGGAWATVNPYQDRSVVLNEALLRLWDRLEQMQLRPIFIEGAYGTPVLGVQLPDGKAYPRNDSAREVALCTMNRMDYFLTDNGGIAFTPKSTGLED